MNERTEAVIARAIALEEMNVVFLLGSDFTIRFANAGVRTLLGYEPEELIGRPSIELVHPDDLAQTLEMNAFETAHPGPRELQKVSLHLRVRAKDGSFRRFEPTGTNLLDDPDVQGFILVLADAEGRAQLDAIYGQIAEGAALRGVLDAIVLLIELEQRGLVAAALTIDGESVMAFGHTVVPTDVPTWSGGVCSSTGGDVGRLEAWFEAGRGPLVFERRGLERAAALAGLAFEREASDAALRHAARTDGLTQLANRTAFNEGIEALERPGESALILVDLDGFKGVNDGFGHAAGDAVLVAVSERLRSVVRRGDLVARIGGDEFAVICGNVPDRDTAMRIALAVADAVRHPIAFDGFVVEVRASIGVCSPIPMSDSERALRSADDALYEAKRGGRDQVVLAS